MKKTGIWLALVLAACALPVIPAPLSAADDTILFGAAISITGKTAKEGEYTRDGYQFAIDKLNELGGVKVGGKTYKLALKYYDDETKPERTAQLIEKLINEDKVNLILGPYGSSPTGTAAPICELPPITRRFCSRSASATRFRWSRRTGRRKASSRRATSTAS